MVTQRQLTFALCDAKFETVAIKKGPKGSPRVDQSFFVSPLLSLLVAMPLLLVACGY